MFVTTSAFLNHFQFHEIITFSSVKYFNKIILNFFHQFEASQEFDIIIHKVHQFITIEDKCIIIYAYKSLLPSRVNSCPYCEIINSLIEFLTQGLNFSKSSCCINGRFDNKTSTIGKTFFISSQVFAS